MPYLLNKPRLWTWTVAGIDVLFGAVYLFGGNANSPTFTLMAQVFPIPMWGAAMTGAGVVLATTRGVAGGMLGAALWTVITLATVISLLQHTAQVAGAWVLPIGIAILHLLITYGSATDHKKGR